jgi:Rieske Fe-S protein
MPRSPLETTVRTRIVLPAVGTVAVAAALALAVPALANTSGPAPTPAQTSSTTAVTPQTATADQGKYPGDPYAGKCVFALTGDSQVHECGTATGR